MKKYTPYLLFLLIIVMFPFGCAHKEGKLYTIAKDPTWSPLNFEQNQGAINTFLAALLINVAKEEHFRVRLLDTARTLLISGLQNEEYDAILSTLTPNIENEKLFDFSDPILSLGPVLIVNKNSKIRSIKDLQGKIIGISPFDNSILLAQKIPHGVIRTYEIMPRALEALEKQEIDGLLMSAIEAEQLVGTFYKTTLQIVTPPLTEEAIRLIVLKGKQTTLIKKLDHSLIDLRKKSEFLKLKNVFLLCHL